jgi:hypothetical protein
VIPCEYSNAMGYMGRLPANSEGFFIVEKDGKFGGINIYNKVVIPFKYDLIRDYSEGLFVVRKDGKYGYINKYNELVIDFKYERAEAFEYGKAAVSLGSNDFLIDQLGEVKRKL